jgi:hypothetical protein
MLNPVLFTWLIVGGAVVYVVAMDANVFDWLVLFSKRATQLVQLQWFKVRHHPDAPWVRYAVERNAKRMAEDFIKHYKQEQENE